jgi:hypothetical protein
LTILTSIAIYSLFFSLLLGAFFLT